MFRFARLVLPVSLLSFALMPLAFAEPQSPPVPTLGGAQLHLMNEAQPALHLINDIEFKNADNTYNAVVEIPAGSADKWMVDAETGQLYWEKENGQPRVISFLPYPANYGFIPQTEEAKENGGDGDPLDVFVLAPAMKPGSVVPVKVLGALRFSDTGERDDKVIAVPLSGPFADCTDLQELQQRHPGALEVVKTWLENYKTPGRMVYQGALEHDDTLKLIERLNHSWLNFDLSYEGE